MVMIMTICVHIYEVNLHASTCPLYQPNNHFRSLEWLFQHYDSHFNGNIHLQRIKSDNRFLTYLRMWPMRLDSANEETEGKLLRTRFICIQDSEVAMFQLTFCSKLRWYEQRKLLISINATSNRYELCIFAYEFYALLW